jgi:FHS family L-fucose permease-like MFS transporter
MTFVYWHVFGCNYPAGTCRLSGLHVIRNNGGTNNDPANIAKQMNPSSETRPQRPWPATPAGHVILSLVVFLFFVRGLSTVLIYALLPKLKSLFQLSYAEAMLTQSCFFLGYFIFSLPAAYIVRRLGYLRAIVLGLVVMITGCLILSPSARFGLYPGFLAALFVLAAGITLLQVADNPLIAALGSSKGSYSRLTLAQAFNSLGTTVAPVIAAWLIFTPAALPFGKQSSGAANGTHLADLQAIHSPFAAIAIVLAVVAVVFWLNRSYPVPRTDVKGRAISCRLHILGNNRFLFGVVAIFLYVGAEVSIGSVMASYLMQPAVLAVPVYRASQLLSLYWGGAMCGRFIGAGLLRIVPPGIALGVCGAMATSLTLLSLSSTGMTAAVAVIAIGLFNSIMFPTIFALALDGLGDAAPEGSGILCMAIVGGAVIPEITGIVADARGFAFALLVPAACYVWITIYGAYIMRHRAPALA